MPFSAARVAWIQTWSRRVCRSSPCENHPTLYSLAAESSLQTPLLRTCYDAHLRRAPYRVQLLTTRHTNRVYMWCTRNVRTCADRDTHLSHEHIQCNCGSDLSCTPVSCYNILYIIWIHKAIVLPPELRTKTDSCIQLKHVTRYFICINLAPANIPQCFNL